MYSGTAKPNAEYDRLYAALIGAGYHAEEAELMAAAACPVVKTVRIARGVGKYKAFDWLNESRRDQFEHAFDHLRAASYEELYGRPMKPGDTEPHVEHALTRLAIEQALERRKAAGA